MFLASNRHKYRATPWPATAKYGRSRIMKLALPVVGGDVVFAVVLNVPLQEPASTVLFPS